MVNSTGLTQVSSVALNSNNTSVKPVSYSAEKVKLEKSTQKEFEALMPRMIKVISHFSKFQGEVPNIIINALGTGLVAPIFIKYNFLSKTDEDTRTYSAWRQPVSAVLAVITQAGMITPFMHLVSKMNNNGEFCGPRYNTTAFPDEKHIQKQLKKENPNLTKKELEDLAKRRYNENIDGLVENAIKNNNIEYKMLNSNGHTTHTLPDEQVRGLLTSVAQKMQKEVDETLKRYAKDKPEHKISRGEYLRTNNQQVRTLLSEIEEQIKAGKPYSEINKGLKTRLDNAISSNADPELRGIIDQLYKRLDNPTLLSEINHQREKCDKFSNCSSSNEVREVVLQNLQKRTDKLQEQRKAISELLDGIKSGKTIGQLHDDLGKVIKDNQFVYDVIQKHISNTKANIKGLNQIIGIGVSVAMLPLTCTLLNYLYPRFMDTFFPSLSDKKKKPHKDDNDTFVKVNGTIPMEVPEDKKGGKL